MGDTSIEWTRKSWNPLRGTKGRHICQRISPGCKNCYAATMNRRFSGIDYVAGADIPRLDANALTEPLGWRAAERCFVCSMTDLFWNEVPDDFIDHVFAVMALCPATTFQVLTKRADRMRAYMTTPDRKRTIAATVMALSNLLAAQAGSGAARIKLDHFSACFKGSGPFANVHLGVSVEHPEYLGRLDDLRATPAARRFVSFEPLLADLGDVCLNGIDWSIFGGESGPGARPCAIAWIRRGVQLARAAHCAVFVKQLGAVPVVGYYSDRWRNYYEAQGWDWPDPIDWDPRNGQPPPGSRVRIKLKDRKGGDMAEWTGPLATLRVREFPR